MGGGGIRFGLLGLLRVSLLCVFLTKHASISVTLP